MRSQDSDMDTSQEGRVRRSKSTARDDPSQPRVTIQVNRVRLSKSTAHDASSQLRAIASDVKISFPPVLSALSAPLREICMGCY